MRISKSSKTAVRPQMVLPLVGCAMELGGRLAAVGITWEHVGLAHGSGKKWVAEAERTANIATCVGQACFKSEPRCAEPRELRSVVRTGACAPPMEVQWARGGLSLLGQ
mmetsp:Transcript_58936/g.140684  ORF Transcript_58936/g.140684 Transcript_58936/m.140684 type:complete len:109 (+) Transcript_58936:511-837(+)